MFIRVKGARPGDPLHEFDIPQVTYERHPDRYKVIDKKPVARQRPASHIPGVVAEPVPETARKTTARKPSVKRAKPSKTAPKTGEEKNAPSAGLTPEEEN